MEEMTRKQPDVDRVTKTYKRKIIEPAHAPFMEKSRGGSSTWQPVVQDASFLLIDECFPSAQQKFLFHFQKPYWI